MPTIKRFPFPRCERVLRTICQELRQAEAEHREATRSLQFVDRDHVRQRWVEQALKLRQELDALAAWHEALSESLEELHVEARGSGR